MNAVVSAIIGLVVVFCFAGVVLGAFAFRFLKTYDKFIENGG